MWTPAGHARWKSHTWNYINCTLIRFILATMLFGLQYFSLPSRELTPTPTFGKKVVIIFNIDFSGDMLVPRIAAMAPVELQELVVKPARWIADGDDDGLPRPKRSDIKRPLFLLLTIVIAHVYIMIMSSFTITYGLKHPK